VSLGLLARLVDRYARWPQRELNDVRAMQILAPLGHRYVAWNASAMRPAGLVAVLNDVVIATRRSIVECGGGISTLYLARLLRQTGGQLTTIEHDGSWAARLRAQIEAEELDDLVSVVTAPLVPVELGFGGRPGEWYDPESLASLRSDPPIDLLIVDGPPAYDSERRHARYPAVPFFRNRLAEDFSIVLDDIGRRGEQEIVAEWERELGIEFERRLAQGRIAIGRSRETYQI
jgi:Methyltransferase domain